MNDQESPELGRKAMPEPKLEPMHESQPAEPHKRLGWPIIIALLGALLAVPVLSLQLGTQRPASPVAPATETPPELAARYAAAFTVAHSRLLPVDLSTRAMQDAVVTLIPAMSSHSNAVACRLL
jgi:hypothetical protein